MFKHEAPHWVWKWKPLRFNLCGCVFPPPGFRRPHDQSATDTMSHDVIGERVSSNLFRVYRHWFPPPTRFQVVRLLRRAELRAGWGRLQDCSMGLDFEEISRQIGHAQERRRKRITYKRVTCRIEIHRVLALPLHVEGRVVSFK